MKQITKNLNESCVVNVKNKWMYNMYKFIFLNNKNN